MTTVLGLGGFDHNGSAAVVQNGRCVSFLEAERVTRRKNQGLDQPAVLDALLTRMSIERVSSVALADHQWSQRRWSWLESYLAVKFPGVSVATFEHHQCHLAVAFAASPFEESVVLSLDGRGDGRSGAGARATREGGINEVCSIAQQSSLGRLWWAASEFAGLPGHHAAGKTMALAAYGTPKYFSQLMDAVSVASDGSFSFWCVEAPNRFSTMPTLVAWMEELTGEITAEEGPSTAHKDMAASVQRFTEELLCLVVERLCSNASLRRLCFAGGVALNGLANHVLLSRGIVQELFVPPCTDDRGLALGAAYLQSWRQTEPPERCPAGISPFLGPEPLPLQSVPEGFVLVAKGTDAIVASAAELLRGALLVFYHGGDEAGPRALGHRSLLALPTDGALRERLNTTIKRREWFRPFGCSIRAEDAFAYFGVASSSPYMLQIVPVSPALRLKIPAVVHADGTTRLQTVSLQTEPTLHALLTELSVLGAPPVVLNTSLNRRGEPMVHRAEEAFQFAKETGVTAVFVSSALYVRAQSSNG